MSLSPPAPRLEATNSGEPCTAGEEWDQLLAPMPPPVLPREWLDDPWTLTQPLAESGPVTHWGLHMAPTSSCLHNSTTKQEDITKASAAGTASIYMGLRLHCSLGQQHGPRIPTQPPVASLGFLQEVLISGLCHCPEPGGSCGIIWLLQPSRRHAVTARHHHASS